MGEVEKKEPTYEEEFSRLFDEISGGGDGSTQEDVVVPPAGEDDKVEPRVEIVTPSPVAGTGVESNPPEVRPEVNPEPKADETDYKSLYDKEVQRTRSWEGRIRAANERASQAEAKAHQLMVDVSELEKRGKTPSELPSISASDDPDIKQFFLDYPELVKPFEKLVVTKGAEIARQVVDERLKEYDPKIKNIEERVNVTVTATHFDLIQDAHADWQSMMDDGEVTRWIEAQPSFSRGNLNRIVTHGTADEAIELLSEVKKARVVPTPQTPPPQKKNPEDLIAVPASRAEVPKPQQERDFDYWWKEANKEK